MQTFTGQQYLKMDIAGSFGLDKEDWDVRLDWFHTNEGNLDHLTNKAETPALFYAGVQAWKDVSQGKPSGFPISLDATSSGLQILSALACDHRASLLCNVISTGHREDAYTSIYKAMVQRLGTNAVIKREQCKDAIMKSLFGSKAEPRKIFGPGEILQVFEETMATEAPGPWELNQVFLNIWNNTRIINSWVLPDNFHVHDKVMRTVEETVRFLGAPYDLTRQINAPITGGRSLGANTIHSIDGMIVREMTRRCSYNTDQIEPLRAYFRDEQCLLPVMTQEEKTMCDRLWDLSRKSGYLSARILDYLDPYWLESNPHTHDELKALLDSMPAKPFQMIAVHDCFRCLPNYANDMRRQYNNQLYLVAKSNLLPFIMSQHCDRPVNAHKLDSFMIEKIPETDYALS